MRPYDFIVYHASGHAQSFLTSDTPHAYRPRPTGKRSWIEWKFITPTSGGPRTTSATACGTWIQSRDGTAGHAVALRKGTAWVASQGSARELGGTSPRYRDPPRSSRHEKKDGINRVHHATPLNPAPFILPRCPALLLCMWLRFGCPFHIGG